jgi:transposase
MEAVMSERSSFVGLDVSLAETAICVIDMDSAVRWRGRAASDPEAIATVLARRAPGAVRVGLEAGQLSGWLTQGLAGLGLPVICIDARQAKAALSMRPNKTDAGDAEGLAQIMRFGWFRQVTVKTGDAEAARALLVARAQLVRQVTALKNTVRGILKTFGLVLPKRLGARFADGARAVIADEPRAAVALPLLAALEAVRAQLAPYDKAVRARARTDATVRLLMSAPGVGPVVALAFAAGVGDPARFAASTNVGVYFGLTPRREQSGEMDWSGHISKRGDAMVRGLLFEAAKVLMSRTAKPCALKDWGARLAARKGARHATTAVARKLAVILHKMWITGTRFAYPGRPQAA